MQIVTRLRYYYITAILSLVLAVVGFSYNAWRLEVTEDNNTVRTAAFEVLKQLAQLEQIIYALHYDENRIEGSPRKGWVAIGLITDLTMLVSSEVDAKAQNLKNVWAENWVSVESNQNTVDLLVAEIDTVRLTINKTLVGLQ